MYKALVQQEVCNIIKTMILKLVGTFNNQSGSITKDNLNITKNSHVNTPQQEITGIKCIIEGKISQL